MVTLNATLRTEDFGSAGSRRLVRAGKVPAEMYGKNGNVHIILDAHDFGLQLRKLAVGKVTQKLLKESKLKVQAAIQEDKVRVTGAKRDDLQAAMPKVMPLYQNARGKRR